MDDCSSESSLVTAAPHASFLQRTLERLSSTQCLQIRAEEAAPVAVIALQRYLSENEAEQLDSYDVTFTDGVWRAKCLLHPGLHDLVHTNSLRTGADVFISQCSYIYNERMLGHGYICIEQLRCQPGRSVVLPQIKDIRSLPVLVKHGMERSVMLQSDVPLQVSRKHYLSLWNNDDPEGDIWSPGYLSPEPVLDVSKITLLCHLESFFKPTWKSLPLLVKIIHKSRLRYYGKHGQKIDFPYQAYFEVADQSGIMSLVLWNELCPEYYQKLNVGTVLYLQNYTLKQSYSNRSHPQMDHHRMKTFNSEICLNPRNPPSFITVISPKRVLPQWGLPEVAYHFVTRSELDSLSNNAACDVIGLVTYVGRIERVKNKATKGPEKYWTYRWIHAVDGTSDHPFILELFSSSQPDIFNHICPMTYLVCTQMRVCQVDGSLSYLTSSFETETFITGYHKGQPYVSDPKVKSFIHWTKTLKDNAVLEKTAVGGHYYYPHPPQKCLQAMADSSAQTLLVAVADLKTEMETLQYREHKRFAIQGQISAVRYTELQTREVPVVRHGGKQNFRKNETVNLIPNPPQDAERRPPLQLEDSDLLSWESSSWEKQQEEVTEHLCQGGLHRDSFHRGFTLDDKDVLLQWSNLQPAHWAPEQSPDTVPPADCPGYYQVTILGINKQIAVDAAFFPIVSTADPRAVGLPQDPHGNTMLSSLSSGFLCPLGDPASTSDMILPEPEEVLATARELEDVHVVCILDLCHLGVDRVEVVLSRVYRVTELRLNEENAPKQMQNDWIVRGLKPRLERERHRDDTLVDKCGIKPTWEASQ
ncbi:hypothetical protein fugu_009241 [Takifugu bimaculatus]|uniref:RPA1 related single stranded DNA binding protein n=1 Tax=Takifugu bimaculatus TaxID=433685 RepID=A0A4Z2AY16_9TELE|nr:hypothetical protein fugu_009241 [Takifugu bimaculatus]